MSPRRSARRSWHDLFGSDADASPPNPEGIEACRRRTPVTHGRPSDEKKGAKPSQPPPPPPVPKNLPLSHPPSEAKNLSGNSQVGREAGKKRKPAPTRESERPGEKRKPAPFERAWSTADELRILTALSKHAESHGDDLPEPSDLFAALAGSFDNWGADADKLADKVRKLRRRHGKARLQGCPGDDHGRRMFELYDKVWGHGASHGSRRGVVTLRRSPRKCNKRGHVHVVAQEANQEGGDEGHAPTRTPEGNWGFAKHVPQQPGRAAVDIGARQDIPVQLSEDGDVNSRRSKDNGGRVEEDRQVKATYVRRHFNELSRLYPYLAQEVKGYTDTHSSGELIMVAFQTIGDEEARNLDARCKKQRIDRLNLEMSQADITKALLCTLAGRIT